MHLVCQDVGDLGVGHVLDVRIPKSRAVLVNYPKLSTQPFNVMYSPSVAVVGLPGYALVPPCVLREGLVVVRLEVEGSVELGLDKLLKQFPVR